MSVYNVASSYEAVRVGSLQLLIGLQVIELAFGFYKHVKTSSCLRLSVLHQGPIRNSGRRHERALMRVFFISFLCSPQPSSGGLSLPGAASDASPPPPTLLSFVDLSSVFWGSPSIARLKSVSSTLLFY